jgi:succinate-acetate transporter protein
MRVVGPRNGSRPAVQIADPAPLGLAALGLTLLIFSMFNAGLLARSGAPIVLGMAVAGGIVQLLAGMWEVRRGNAMALYFIAWTIFSVLLWVASTRTTAVTSVMLAALSVSLLLLGIGDAGAHSEIVKIGGWFGLAATAAALYGAFAGAINGTYARTLLPLVPLQLRRTAG